MGRLLAWAVVGAVAYTLAAGAAAVRADEPAGPRIAFAEMRTESNEATEVATVGPAGGGRRTLRSGSDPEVNPLGGLSWSPDGSELAFVGEVHSKDTGTTRRAIYVVSAAGGSPRRVAGTGRGLDPVWSPDGSEIAFSRHREHSDIRPAKFHFSLYSSTTTWIVAAGGGKPRRLTAWGNGRFAEPSSFTPDGRRLALTLERTRRAPEAVLLDLRTGRTSVIAREARDPAVSPDGRRVALVSFRDHVVAGEGEERTAVGELYTVDPSGGHPQRLTRTPDRQEEAPSWDPAGARIAFVQGTVQWAVGLTGVIEEVNADGSCPRLVAGKPKVEGRYGPPLDGPGLYSPVWQPGVDRGASPLSCDLARD